jgi:predicted transcriptional regulator
MHGKGMLIRDETQRPQLYAPAIAQEKFRPACLKTCAPRCLQGSGRALVLTALKDHVSADERTEIEKILRRKEKAKS